VAVETLYNTGILAPRADIGELPAIERRHRCEIGLGHGAGLFAAAGWNRGSLATEGIRSERKTLQGTVHFAPSGDPEVRRRPATCRYG
jgi:hypothetical protein